MEKGRYKIFIVEDDEKLAELLAGQLERYGYLVQRCESFQNVDEEVLESKAHLCLLDINLPYYDGFYWCRRIRMHSKMPILYVSARGGNMDQVLALENGGDDFIKKPFEPEVLIAKVAASLRRAYGEYSGDAQSSDSVEHIECNGLVLDVFRKTATFGEHTVTFSVTESELLRLFIQAKGMVVDRETLLTSLWDDQTFVDDNTLTVNVTRVRKKLAEMGLQGVVLTVRGQGYRLDTVRVAELYSKYQNEGQSS